VIYIDGSVKIVDQTGKNASQPAERCKSYTIPNWALFKT